MVGACPPASDNEETLTWDASGEKCLKSTTSIKYGDYESQTAEVVANSVCCDKAILPETDQGVAEDLVFACPVLIEWDCILGKNEC